MRTRTFRISWLVAVLGIALVCGGYFAVKSYLGYTEQIASGARFDATLDRCFETVHLGGLLGKAQGSRCMDTARGLDDLLSTRLAAEWARVESAGRDAQTLMEAMAKFIDRRRSEGPPLAGNMPGNDGGDRAAWQLPLTDTH